MRVTFTQRTMKLSGKVVHPPCFCRLFFFLLLSSRHCHLHTSNPKLLWNRWWITKWVTFFSFTWRVLCIHPGGSQQLFLDRSIRSATALVAFAEKSPSLDDCITLRIICSHSIHSQFQIGIVWELFRYHGPPIALFLVGPVEIHRVGKSRSLL